MSLPKILARRCLYLNRDFRRISQHSHQKFPIWVLKFTQVRYVYLIPSYPHNIVITSGLLQHGRLLYSVRFLGTGATYPQRFYFEVLPERTLSFFLSYFATQGRIRLVMTYILYHIFFNFSNKLRKV